MTRIEIKYLSRKSKAYYEWEVIPMCRPTLLVGHSRNVATVHTHRKTIKLRFRSGPEHRERVSIWHDDQVQSRAKHHGPL